MSRFAHSQLLQMLQDSRPLWPEPFDHVKCYAFAVAVRKCLESSEAKKIRLRKSDIFNNKRDAMCAFAAIFEENENDAGSAIQCAYFQKYHRDEILALCIIAAFNVVMSDPELKSEFTKASESDQGEMLKKNAPHAYGLWERLH